MNFPLYIAKRYLISKKSRNAINIISFISILGVCIGTTALIIILSVFNGFNYLLKDLYDSFDPDIKIVNTESKTFTPQKEYLDFLNESAYIESYSLCLEENVMLQYEDKHIIATIKGVDDNFRDVTKLDLMISQGDYIMDYHNVPCALVGQGIAYALRISLNSSEFIKISIPSRTKEFKGNFQDVSENINKLNIYPMGIFSIQQEYDGKYVIIPLKYAQELLEHESNISSIEIKLNKSSDLKSSMKEIEKLFGKDFSILDRNMQHEYAYKIMKSEKWAIFLILVFILLIASFNIIGSLTMLIIEKKNDIIALKNLGANNKTIRKIFFIEGFFISLIGAVTGLILGLSICWLQVKYKIVGLGSEGSFIIDAYPVKVETLDILYVFCTVILIGAIAAYYPIRYITKKYIDINS